MKSTFYFYANPFHSRSAEAAHALSSAIKKRGGRVLTEQWLSDRGVGEPCPMPDMPGDTRAIVAIGGDGTLLMAAPEAVRKNVPIVGVHTGTVGFLMQGEADKPEQLADTLTAPEYSLASFPLLQIGYDGQSYLAINDLALTRGEHPGVIEVIARADGEEVFRAHGDGAVVSTPLGATAYGLSAGGPIVRHDVPCMLLTPLCARELLLRPVILPLGAKVTLLAHGQERRRLQLAIDGQTLLPVTHEAKVEITTAKETIQMISLRPSRFFATLRRKQAVWNDYEIQE
ncbi:MAG: NAD(+)/NADH kinase [Clostridia bacterium]|nr:NAD(+)/NADH kinase [Clostridia bacterium]